MIAAVPVHLDSVVETLATYLGADDARIAKLRDLASE